MLHLLKEYKMTEPELIHMDYSLFRADGQWHHIGHGIEVRATLDMWAGSFYIRAQEPAPCETCAQK
jgi:hypothetical protein